MSRGGSLGEGLSFLGRFVCRPGCVGAVWPSSPALARAMAAAAGARKARVIAEIGPGTGALTPPLLQAVRGRGEFLAIEIDPRMCELFRAKFPGARLVEGDAAGLPKALEEAGLGRADAIVSGLPWAAFPRELQERILGGALGGLRPGGRFVTFAYVQGLALPAGRRFRRLLDATFAKVEVSPVVWRNIPPAVVYRCRKGQ